MSAIESMTPIRGSEDIQSDHDRIDMISQHQVYRFDSLYDKSLRISSTCTENPELRKTKKV